MRQGFCRAGAERTYRHSGHPHGRLADAAGSGGAVRGEHAGGTRSGGTFTFDEPRADLTTAGSTPARVRRRNETMNCLVVAKQPGGKQTGSVPTGNDCREKSPTQPVFC